MRERRMYLRIFFILTVFGALNLLTMLNRPALVNIRGVDIVHLIGTGMCFGGAIFSLVAYLYGGKSS